MAPNVLPAWVVLSESGHFPTDSDTHPSAHPSALLRTSPPSTGSWQLMADQEQYDEGRNDEGIQASNLSFHQSSFIYSYIHSFPHRVIWKETPTASVQGQGIQVSACQSQWQGRSPHSRVSSPDDQRPGPRGMRDR